MQTQFPKKIIRTIKFILSLTSAWVFSGCMTSGPIHEQNLVAPHGMPELDLKAVSRSGSQVKGNIEIVQEENRLRIVAKFVGLEPNSKHGFHIHERNDCSAKDASSAGGHFNPDGNPHAGPFAKKHHAGDLGNISTNEQGVAKYQRIFGNLTLLKNEQAHSILGRSIVLHARGDDFKSQPSGNAGSRIACAEIPKTLSQ